LLIKDDWYFVKDRGGEMKKVLFVCVENAGRSQMAEAFAKRYGEGKVEALGAGTMPSSEVNPVVIEVMKEKGFDLSKNRPKPVGARMVQEADVVIVMGCEAQGFCPAPMLKKVEDWEIEDPKEKSIKSVREIRDEIERKVKKLIAKMS